MTMLTVFQELCECEKLREQQLKKLDEVKNFLGLVWWLITLNFHYRNTK